MARNIAVVVSLIVCILLMIHGGHIDACYLRNCPVGGKRALNTPHVNSLIHWIDPFQSHAAVSNINFNCFIGLIGVAGGPPKDPQSEN